jgi:hypothetical protein
MERTFVHGQYTESERREEHRSCNGMGRAAPPFTCYEPKKTARTHYLKIYVEKEERSIEAAIYL